MTLRMRHFLWILLTVNPASGFVHLRVPRVAHRRQSAAPRGNSVTALSYKVLGAPQEGSFKPSVLEEGTNKVQKGDLSGGNSRYFPRRYDEDDDVYDISPQSSYQQANSNRQDQTYSSYGGNTQDNDDAHTEELRHWGGVLELATQRYEPDGNICVAGTPWEAGSALADFMSNPDANMEWQDVFVVELGSGIGTTAIVGGMLGARVVATDGVILDALQQNVDKYQEYCNYSVQVAPLVWGDNDAAYQVCQGQYPDMIVAADVIYAGSDVASLQATLDTICGPETWILLAHTWRDADQEQYFLDSLMEQFERFDMDAALLPPAFQNVRPDGRPAVSIFMYRRRQ